MIKLLHLLSSVPLEVRPTLSNSYSSLAVQFVKDRLSGVGMVQPR